MAPKRAATPKGPTVAEVEAQWQTKQGAWAVQAGSLDRESETLGKQVNELVKARAELLRGLANAIAQRELQARCDASRDKRLQGQIQHLRSVLSTNETRDEGQEELLCDLESNLSRIRDDLEQTYEFVTAQQATPTASDALAESTAELRQKVTNMRKKKVAYEAKLQLLSQLGGEISSSRSALDMAMSVRKPHHAILVGRGSLVDWLARQMMLRYGFTIDRVTSNSESGGSVLACWDDIAKMGRRGEPATESSVSPSSAPPLVHAKPFFQRRSFSYSPSGVSAEGTRVHHVLCDLLWSVARQSCDQECAVVVICGRAVPRDAHAKIRNISNVAICLGKDVACGAEDDALIQIDPLEILEVLYRRSRISPQTMTVIDCCGTVGGFILAVIPGSEVLYYEYTPRAGGGSDCWSGLGCHALALGLGYYSTVGKDAGPLAAFMKSTLDSTLVSSSVQAAVLPEDVRKLLSEVALPTTQLVQPISMLATLAAPPHAGQACTNCKVWVEGVLFSSLEKQVDVTETLKSVVRGEFNASHYKQHFGSLDDRPSINSVVVWSAREIPARFVACGRAQMLIAVQCSLPCSECLRELHNARDHELSMIRELRLPRTDHKIRDSEDLQFFPLLGGNVEEGCIIVVDWRTTSIDAEKELDSNRIASFCLEALRRLPKTTAVLVRCRRFVASVDTLSMWMLLRVAEGPNHVHIDCGSGNCEFLSSLRVDESWRYPHTDRGPYSEVFMQGESLAVARAAQEMCVAVHVVLFRFADASAPVVDQYDEARGAVSQIQDAPFCVLAQTAARMQIIAVDVANESKEISESELSGIEHLPPAARAYCLDRHISFPLALVFGVRHRCSNNNSGGSTELKTINAEPMPRCLFAPRTQATCNSRTGLCLFRSQQLAQLVTAYTHRFVDMVEGDAAFNSSVFTESWITV